MNDIKEAKGRKTRKIFDNNNFPTSSQKARDLHAKSRVDAGDPNYTKFLVIKERAHH